jgi:hypothetical protein
MNAIAKPENTQPAVSTDSATLLNIISRAAADPAVDMDKMERLLKMHEQVVARNAEQAFNAAMSFAQGKMVRVSADSTNPQTRSKYASYAALDRALRPIYTEAGFSLSFGTGEGAPQDWARVLCYVSHRDGHSRTYHIDMPADGKGAKGGDVMTKTHATGSAMTYGMRYLLKLIFNVAIGEDDDDGNAHDYERITETQAADLSALLDEVGADKVKFCAYFKIGKIEELPAKAYKQAVTLAEAKRK